VQIVDEPQAGSPATPPTTMSLLSAGMLRTTLSHSLLGSASGHLGPPGALRGVSAAIAPQVAEGLMREEMPGVKKMQPGLQFYQLPFEVSYKDVAARRNLRKLEALFFEADTDGSGAMSIDEFNEALRVPRIQRAFSVLGVQPHQSELVFKSLDKAKTGQLRIDDFMVGLTELVRYMGVNGDGSSRELDIDTMRASYTAARRLLDRSGADAPGRGAGSFGRAQAEESSRPSSRASSCADSRPGSRQSGSAFGIGPVHRLPDCKLQRAFVHSASANALHPALAVKRAVPTFPFDQREQHQKYARPLRRPRSKR